MFIFYLSLNSNKTLKNSQFFGVLLKKQKNKIKTVQNKQNTNIKIK